ncbi:hypothetical protein [Streptomyces akebiae]|uniref:Uncharacterized protein n=1 Tax=Streptomyces akebiae TaxID=2865673 RepID=A0ABX8XUI7_9ACTN|nr:hypothetical protein [Streptomyces akebiae]QYX79037.1 hypothetical protein K1J60_23225 [Streptomyces akebiae]
MKRRRASAVATVLGCAALLVNALEGTAAGHGWGRGDALPLPGYGDAVVDGGHRQVFVSGGADGQSVAAVRLPGRGTVRVAGDVQLIDGQQGAHGMVLSQDGKSLYVALAAGDAVSVIDTETLKETARYRAGADQNHLCPTHLARTGTVLWIGYGCEAWEGGIARLDTAAEKPEMELDQQGATIRFERAPALAAPAGDSTATSNTGQTLVASQPHLSPVRLLAYTVGADGKLSLDADERRGGSNLNDLALTPDGSRLLTAAGSEDRVQGFTARKGEGLGDKGAWFTQQAPVAVAPSPDGTLIATGVRSAGPKGKQVNVYPLDGTEPVWSAALPRHERLADRGLVWLPDGSALAAVTTRDDDPAPRLNILKRSAPGGWVVDWSLSDSER